MIKGTSRLPLIGLNTTLPRTLNTCHVLPDVTPHSSRSMRRLIVRGSCISPWSISLDKGQDTGY
jgi:hypothetical protein